MCKVPPTVRRARVLGSELAYWSARSALRRPSQFPNCPYLSLHSAPCFTPYLDIFKSPFSDTFPIFSLATTHVYKIASWLLRKEGKWEPGKEPTFTTHHLSTKILPLGRAITQTRTNPFTTAREVGRIYLASPPNLSEANGEQGSRV
jgi:hypothetical protein